MKILYTVPRYPTGKHHGFLDEIASLQKRNITVEIIPVWASDRKAKVDDLPLKILYDPNQRWQNLWVKPLLCCLLHPLRSFYFIKSSRQFLGYLESFFSLSLLTIIQKSNSDHIHAYFANNAALKILLISKTLGIPFSCSGRGTDVLIKRIPAFKFLVNNSQPFFTLSHYNKEKISQLPGINADNIHVIHHGIQVNRFQAILTNSADGPLKIVSTTWLRAVKGVSFLIEACHLLAKDQVDFECRIIGDGYLRADLEKQIQDHQLEEQVKLEGFLPHNKTLSCVRQSDIFVLPSLSEGIAIAVMEAMAIGLPVIVTDITGMPELVQHDQTGILVPPKDAEAIASEIKQLRDKDLRNRLAKKGQKYVQKHFNIDININQFLSIIREK